MGRRIALGLALLAGLPGPVPAVTDLAQEELVVIIANPDSEVKSITRSELAKIFLKRLRTWDTGVAANPVDQAPDRPARRRFSKEVLDRSVVNVEVYWKRMIFSGRSLPPPEVGSDGEVVEFVRTTPGAVGYISAAETELTGVRVLALSD